MSKINKINVSGTSYDIEDKTAREELVNKADKNEIPTVPTKLSELDNDSGFITSYTESDPTVPDYVKEITEENITSWNNKQEPLTAGDNITIEDNVISASGGGGKEPIILEAGSYNVNRTTNSLYTSSEATGSKLISEIRTKLANFTETDDIYLRVAVNYGTFGTTSNKTTRLLKCTHIQKSQNSWSNHCLNFELFDGRDLKAGAIYKYNYQIAIRFPANFTATTSNYYLFYNEVQLAGRRYTSASSANEITMASRDVIFKDDTEAFTPTANTHPANKGYVDKYLTTLTGYDASKTQVLKNVNGTLQWLDE